MKPASIAAQGLGWVDDHTRALVPPIHTSTTFIRDPDNQYRSGRSYARDQNPTFDQAEAVLTALEGGHASLLFASGMAAATALFQALSPGEEIFGKTVAAAAIISARLSVTLTARMSAMSQLQVRRMGSGWSDMDARPTSAVA